MWDEKGNTVPSLSARPACARRVAATTRRRARSGRLPAPPSAAISAQSAFETVTALPLRLRTTGAASAACGPLRPRTVAQASGVAKYYTGDSIYRDFRARQLLEPRIGDITVDDIKAVLRDQFGAPRAICRSPHDYPGQAPTMTIASLLFDPLAGTMEVAPGQPTHSQYQRVALPAAARLQAMAV